MALQGSSINLNQAGLGSAQAGSIYWVGANGHVYVKGSGGNGSAVTDNGLATGSNTANLILNGARQIDDPNVPQAPGTPDVVAPPNPNNNTASAAPAKVDKSNDIALQNAGLAAVDSQYNTGVAAIDTTLAALQGRYGDEATANEKSFTDNSNNNTNNLQKNKQTAYVNASQGRQGLFGSLASIGALSGDGITLANRAVQKGANDDLSGAADNYDTNQGGLNTSIETFRRENKNRGEDAVTNAKNAKMNAENEAAKSRLSYYGNLVNDYSAMGDEGNAKAFTSKAAELYPTLARTSVPNANISYSGAAFTPGTLQDYLAGAGSTVVNTTPSVAGGDIPGLVASPTKKKQLVATI